MKKLENKTVFITGGLSGIDKACAIAAAKHEANVAVVGGDNNNGPNPFLLNYTSWAIGR